MHKIAAPSTSKWIPPTRISLLATVTRSHGRRRHLANRERARSGADISRTLAWANGSGLRAELTATRNTVPATTFYAATGEQSTAALGGPACGATQAGVVRRSTDLGLTWSAPGAMPNATGFCGGQCFYDIAIAVTPDNQTIHLGGAAGNSAATCGANVMKRSLNGGTTWASNNATLHADEHALAIAPSNPQIVYTGSDGGIWRSTNNGTTWQTLNNVDFSATQFQGVAVHPYDRNFLMGGTQDNGTICWAANGTVSHCRDGDGGYAVIDDNAQDTFNVLMYHTFFNQTNNQIGFERASNTLANADGQLSGWTFRGCSGTTSNNGFRCADNVLFYAPMNQGPGSPINTLYFGTDRLYRSTNRGDTMTLVSQGPLVPSAPAGSGVVVTSIGISPQDDNVRLVGLRDGHVFATTTGSAVMTDVTGGNFPPPNPVDLTRNSIGETVIDPNNKFTAYISFTSFSPPSRSTDLQDDKSERSGSNLDAFQQRHSAGSGQLNCCRPAGLNLAVRRHGYWRLSFERWWRKLDAFGSWPAARGCV